MSTATTTTTRPLCASVDVQTLCSLSFAETGWEREKEKNITVASTKSIYFKQPSPMVVQISFHVIDYDITLTANFRRSSSSRVEVVGNLERKKEGVFSYSFPESGSLELVFDNSYAKWHYKTITYTTKTRSQMCESTGERILRSIAIHNGHTQMIALPDNFFDCIKYRGAPISTAQPALYDFENDNLLEWRYMLRPDALYFAAPLMNDPEWRWGRRHAYLVFGSRLTNEQKFHKDAFEAYVVRPSLQHGAFAVFDKKWRQQSLDDYNRDHTNHGLYLNNYCMHKVTGALIPAATQVEFAECPLDTMPLPEADRVLDYISYDDLPFRQLEYVMGKATIYTKRPPTAYAYFRVYAFRKPRARAESRASSHRHSSRRVSRPSRPPSRPSHHPPSRRPSNHPSDHPSARRVTEEHDYLFLYIKSRVKDNQFTQSAVHLYEGRAHDDARVQKWVRDSIMGGEGFSIVTDVVSGEELEMTGFKRVHDVSNRERLARLRRSSRRMSTTRRRSSSLKKTTETIARHIAAANPRRRRQTEEELAMLPLLIQQAKERNRQLDQQIKDAMRARTKRWS